MSRRIRDAGDLILDRELIEILVTMTHGESMTEA
jgi:hypothetical protein